MKQDKGTKNLRVSLFVYPGENAGIHQEAKQTARNESLHRLGPSASPAVPHLTGASPRTHLHGRDLDWG